MTTPLLERMTESRTYTFDFSLFPEIVGGETLAAITIQPAATPSGPTVSAGTIVASGPYQGKAVTCTIGGTGAVNGTTYRMLCTCRTSGNNVLTCGGYLLLQDL